MHIEIYNKTKTFRYSSHLRSWIQAVLRILARQKRIGKAKTLQVAIVMEGESQRLNHQFRQKNYATDVLSFAPLEAGSMGELVICWPVVKKQAKEHGLTFKEELGYMALHGILHLLGYDDHTKTEYARMWKKQEAFVEKLSEIKL